MVNINFIKKNKIEIILLLIAALAHFFFFFLLLKNYGPDSFYNPNEDTIEFFQLGKNLHEHGILSDRANPPFYLSSFRTILYPAFLALFRIFDDGAWLPIVFQNILAIFSVIIVYKIGLLVVKSRKISFLAALIFAIDPLQNYIANVYLPDTFFIFLAFLSIFYFLNFWLLFRNRQIGYYKFLVISAIFLGLATLVKPVTYYFPILFGLFLLTVEIINKQWRRAIKPIFVFSFIFFIVIFPWFIRNWYHFKVFDLSAVAGFNMCFYAAELGPYPDYINEPLLEIKNKYGWDGQNGDGTRDLRAQSIMKKVCLKRIFEEPLAYSKYHILGMVKFFLDDGHKAAYYNKHYKAMLFYNTPEPSDKPNISEELRKGNFGVIWQIVKNANQYMVIYILSKIIYILGYLVVLYGLIRSYKQDKKIFSIFLLFLSFAAFISLAAGPYGSEVRYRLLVWPWILLIFSYGLFELFGRLQNKINIKITSKN